VAYPYDTVGADSPWPARRLLDGHRAIISRPPLDIDQRVWRVTVSSRALGIAKAFYVFLPPSYGRNERRYPVLYLLRGHEREWVNAAEDGSRGGTVIDVYLRLLQQRRVGEMILVFPGLTSDDNRVHSLATDFRARALAPDSPGLGTGRFESFLVAELVPLVDELFRTQPGGAHRGVDGFSLGGYMAVKLAARYPELFATAGAYDGTFLYADDSGQRIRDDDRVFGAALFDAVFGHPRDHAYAAANSPANLILAADAERLRGIRWLIQYGPRHLEPMGSNYIRGAYLRGVLAERGITGMLPQVIAGGRHDWATADRHMHATLPLHWLALRKPQV
jgi:predicted alpha/beta superfamily hydrolase